MRGTARGESPMRCPISRKALVSVELSPGGPVVQWSGHRDTEAAWQSTLEQHGALRFRCSSRADRRRPAARAIASGWKGARTGGARTRRFPLPMGPACFWRGGDDSCGRESRLGFSGATTRHTAPDGAAVTQAVVPRRAGQARGWAGAPRPARVGGGAGRGADGGSVRPRRRRVRLRLPSR
jgi:hypothetical protein